MGKNRKNDKGLNSRGSDSSDEEILRGKHRELQKEIKKLTNYINQLESQLEMKPKKDKKVEKEEIPKEKKREPLVTCTNCKSGEIKIIEIVRLGGTLTLAECGECGHRQKINNS